METQKDKLTQPTTQQTYGASSTYHTAKSTPLLALSAEPQVYHGYVNGACQPLAVIHLRVALVNTLQLAHLEQACAYYFANHTQAFVPMQTLDDVAACFGFLITTLQKVSGFPVFDELQCTRIEDKADEFKLFIPTLFAGCFHQIAAFIMKFINHHAVLTPFLADPGLITKLNTLVQALKNHAPQGSNTLRFLKAAHEARIPWRHMALNTFQIGQGIHARWFDSSLTDLSPSISVSLAGDKLNAAMLMRNTGLPVPNHYLAQTEEEAIAYANALGYPVVVKPLDQDGGKGVYAKLVSEQGVRKAFQQARQYSQSVLVEKHVVGKDYRLVVVKGVLIWAIERIPAGVSGDGINTIDYLVAQHNQQHAYQYPLRHISLTQDTNDYLAEQRLTMSSIPRAGQFVALNRIANISMGGTPVGVLDKVHPDNKRLAEAAAKLLRLDIAGVDFISPDIEQSYLTNNGKLIEVNAKPQLGSTTAPHLYQQILSMLVPNQGRIPIFVICGDESQVNFAQKLQKQLSQRYDRVGIAKENTAMINNEVLVSAQSLFEAGQFLLLQQDLEAMIYCINHPRDIAQEGLPFSDYDSLFFFSDPLKGSDWLDTLHKACRGKVIRLESASQAETAIHSIAL